jgi:N-acetyl-anhydromuramyl-L-alanine amidase AmpD
MANFSNHIMVAGNLHELGGGIRVVGFWDNPEYGFHGVGGVAPAPGGGPAVPGLAIPGLEAAAPPEPTAAPGRPPTRPGLRDPPVPGQRDANLAALAQRVRHVVIHHDATYHSDACFRVLNARSLSTHFMINFDGGVIQGLDVWWKAIHAREFNPTSVGIDMNNVASVEGHQTRRQDPLFGGVADYETRPVVRGPAGGSGDQESFEYTEAQYETLAAILRILNETIGLPLIYPQAETGGVVTRRLRDPMNFRGFFGHWHCQAGKWDPGPGFYWDQVMERLHGKTNHWPLVLPGVPELRELQSAETVAQATQVFFENNERSRHGGTYPLEQNQQWSDGIRLYPEERAPIYACAQGKIILTRNGPNLPMGSPNFVLVQHDFTRERIEVTPEGDSILVQEPVRWYSLYMHMARLDHERVPPETPAGNGEGGEGGDGEGGGAAGEGAGGPQAMRVPETDLDGNPVPEWFVRMVWLARQRKPTLQARRDFTLDEVESDPAAFYNRVLGYKTLQDLEHIYQCVEDGNPYQWVQDPTLDNGVPVEPGDLIGYAGEFGALRGRNITRTPAVHLQVFSRMPIFDDTLFPPSMWRRAQSDHSGNLLCSDRNLILTIMGGPDQALVRDLSRTDFAKGRLVTPSEIASFYRTGPAQQRQRFRTIIGSHLSQWDEGADESLTADIRVLWPWMTDAEFVRWRAHHVGFKWLTDQVRPLLGMEPGIPETIYTYHPIYLLGWWALNYGRSINTQTFEALDQAAFEEEVRNYEADESDWEGDEESDSLISVDDIDDFRLSYPELDSLDPGEWNPEFEIEEN